MAITDRNLTAGTILKARYKGEVFTCEVKEGDGKNGLVYAITGKGLRKQTHPTIGKATAAVTAPAICANRWHFWTREADFDAQDGQKAQDRAERQAEKKATAKAPKAAKPKEAPVRRSKNPKAKAERFACGECGLNYPTQTRAMECLKRHRAEAEGAQEPESQVPAGES